MRIPLRLVVDTNVVLDLFHFNRPSVAALRTLIESGEALCFASHETLTELRQVISREHFRLDDAGQQALAARHAASSIILPQVTGSQPLPQCKDASDQKFIVLAVEVSADYLLTRDKAVLKLARRVRKVSRLSILTPERMPLPSAWQPPSPP